MSLEEKHNNEQKVRSINWFPWLLAIVMGGLMLSKYIDPTGTTGISTSGYSWLSLLLVLICPLMMFFMMSGHGNSCHRSTGNEQENHNAHDDHKGCCGGHMEKKNSNQ